MRYLKNKKIKIKNIIRNIYSGLYVFYENK